MNTSLGLDSQVHWSILTVQWSGYSVVRPFHLSLRMALKSARWKGWIRSFRALQSPKKIFYKFKSAAHSDRKRVSIVKIEDQLYEYQRKLWIHIVLPSIFRFSSDQWGQTQEQTKLKIATKVTTIGKQKSQCEKKKRRAKSDLETLITAVACW